MNAPFNTPLVSSPLALQHAQEGFDADRAKLFTLRHAVGDYVYYSVRGWTCGDDTPAEIRAGAFRIVRNWLSRGASLHDAICHVERLAFSASLA
jgi:hypothetical protein